jgi:hypothetical protein
MHVTVTRKEETSFNINHQSEPNQELEIFDVEELISFLQHEFSRPQCCECCEDVDLIPSNIELSGMEMMLIIINALTSVDSVIVPAQSHQHKGLKNAVIDGK